MARAKRPRALQKRECYWAANPGEPPCGTGKFTLAHKAYFDPVIDAACNPSLPSSQHLRLCMARAQAMARLAAERSVTHEELSQRAVELREALPAGILPLTIDAARSWRKEKSDAGVANAS